VEVDDVGVVSSAVVQVDTDAPRASTDVVGSFVSPAQATTVRATSNPRRRRPKLVQLLEGFGVESCDIKSPPLENNDPEPSCTATDTGAILNPLAPVP
jgi:hypothetical protein